MNIARYSSHRQKYTAYSSRESFEWKLSRFLFRLSTVFAYKLGPTDKKKEKKETPAFLESRSAKASSTKYLSGIGSRLKGKGYSREFTIS